MDSQIVSAAVSTSRQIGLTAATAETYVTQVKCAPAANVCSHVRMDSIIVAATVSIYRPIEPIVATAETYVPQVKSAPAESA